MIRIFCILWLLSEGLPSSNALIGLLSRQAASFIKVIPNEFGPILG
jgi:hypothetical protein